MFISCTLCLVSFVSIIEATVFRNDDLRTGNFKKTHQGMVLNNHVIATRHVSSQVDCVLECLGIEQCVSYNYQETSSTDSHTCELNNSTLEFSKVQDFKARDGFFHGQSFLQNYNSGPCITSPCKHNGICVGIDDNIYECGCKALTMGDDCEQWKDDAKYYTLIFPRNSTSDYISAVSLNKSQVTFLTMCVSVNYVATGWNTLFSYSTNSTTTMLAIRCHNTGKCEITVNSVSSEVYTSPLNDGTWHHVCFSWTNIQGILKFYVDGAMRSTKKTVNSNLVITGTGKLIIGQLQASSVELTFNPSYSFMGNMYGFNMWDAVKEPSEILSYSKQCICEPGNLVDWKAFLVNEAHGLIRKVRPSACSFNVSKTANLSSSAGEKYIKMNFTASLREVTVCFWSRRNEWKQTSTAFSYYSTTLDYALQWTFYASSTYKVYAAGVQMLVYSSLHYKDAWHHFCYTWSSTDGRFMVFIDGVVVLKKLSVAAGKTIEGNGMLVFGQQISPTSVFSVSDDSYYVGYLTNFNLWNIALSGHVIASMAKAATRDLGNELNWNEVVYGGEAIGGLSFTEANEVTTNASKSDFYLDFGSIGSTSNYVEFRNPILSVTRFVLCYWVWSKSSAQVFAYSIQSESDEWGTYIYPNQAALVIHGTWKYSTSGNTIDGGWSPFCWRWKNSDGTSEFYQDGKMVLSLTGYNTGYTIPGGGYFILGQDMDSHKGSFSSSQSLTGYLGHFNIWDTYELPQQSIEEMSRGASAFEGTIVPWSSLRTNIHGTVTVVEPSPCTLPDFSSTELREKWCNDNIQLASCSGPLYPLFDNNKDDIGRRLRCYCKNILVKDSAGHYKYDPGSASYATRDTLRTIKT